jgi:hypothetical protein
MSLLKLNATRNIQSLLKKILSNLTDDAAQIMEYKKNQTSYEGCTTKLYFDNQFYLAQIISVYCSRVCKPMCLKQTDPVLLKNKICQITCPILCECDLS